MGKKFLIIGNCQVQPLMHGVARHLHDFAGEAIGVHVHNREVLEGIADDFVTRRSEFAFVLSMPLSEAFGVLGTALIAQTFAPTPVFLISNLTFTGLHPDLTYLGDMERRVIGPIGDYHSKIAGLCFVSGLPISETLKYYCDTTFDYLGYYEEFEISKKEFHRREKYIDVKFGAELFELIRLKLSFLSHNHPTTALTTPYAKLIAQSLEQRGVAVCSHWIGDSFQEVNYLADSAIFPIYPEIAKRHSLCFKGDYKFKTATTGDVTASVYGLKRFLEGEYSAFSYYGVESIQSLYPINLMLQRFGSVQNWPDPAIDMRLEDTHPKRGLTHHLGWLRRSNRLRK